MNILPTPPPLQLTPMRFRASIRGKEPSLGELLEGQRRPFRNIFFECFGELWYNTFPSTRRKVTFVRDGDTFKVRYKNTNIRLEIIDSPELSQKLGVSSKEALEELIKNKRVILGMGGSSFDRQIGRVYVKRWKGLRRVKLDVAQVMLESGMAYVERKHTHPDDIRAYRPFEEAAKTAKKGVWGSKNAGEEPPAMYRARQKQKDVR